MFLFLQCTAFYPFFPFCFCNFFNSFPSFDHFNWFYTFYSRHNFAYLRKLTFHFPFNTYKFGFQSFWIIVYCDYHVNSIVLLQLFSILAYLRTKAKHWKECSENLDFIILWILFKFCIWYVISDFIFIISLNHLTLNTHLFPTLLLYIFFKICLSYYKTLSAMKFFVSYYGNREF